MPSNNTSMSTADVLNMSLSNGQTVKQAMESAAKMLVKYLQDGIDLYYDWYEPVKRGYTRTNKLRKAVTVNDITTIRVDNNFDGGYTASISVYFNGNKWHRSVGGHHTSDVVTLINDGWSVSRGNHRNVPRFGYYGGYHFVESALANFNANNPLGIEARLVGGVYIP